jgi:hypothetical protein
MASRGNLRGATKKSTRPRPSYTSRILSQMARLRKANLGTSYSTRGYCRSRPILEGAEGGVMSRVIPVK